MKWISVEKQLPEPGKRVNISFGLFGIRAAVCDDWVSTGWITKSGVWSIKWKPNSAMHKMSKPDHWCEINGNATEV